MYKLNDLPERNKISFYTVFFYEMLFLCLYFLGTCFVKLKKNSTFYFLSWKNHKYLIWKLQWKNFYIHLGLWFRFSYLFDKKWVL